MTRLLRSDYKDYIKNNNYSSASLNIVIAVKIVQGSSNTTIQHLLRTFRSFHWCSAQNAYLVDPDDLDRFMHRCFYLSSGEDTTVEIRRERVKSALSDLLW